MDETDLVTEGNRVDWLNGPSGTFDGMTISATGHTLWEKTEGTDGSIEFMSSWTCVRATMSNLLTSKSYADIHLQNYENDSIALWRFGSNFSSYYDMRPIVDPGTKLAQCTELY